MSLKEKTDALALAAIDLHGLSVIHDPIGHDYAISIDASGNEPTDEQRAECFWYATPADAAYAYCKRNGIKMGVPSER